MNNLSNIVQIYFYSFGGVFFIYLFIYLFLTVLGLRFVQGLFLIAASGGHSSSRYGDRSSSRCAGLSLSWPLPLQGTGLEVYFQGKFLEVVLLGQKVDTHIIFLDIANPCP